MRTRLKLISRTYYFCHVSVSYKKHGSPTAVYSCLTTTDHHLLGISTFPLATFCYFHFIVYQLEKLVLGTFDPSKYQIKFNFILKTLKVENQSIFIAPKGDFKHKIIVKQ